MGCGEGQCVMYGRGFGVMTCMFVNSWFSNIAMYLSLCVFCVLHGEESRQCMAR